MAVEEKEDLDALAAEESAELQRMLGESEEEEARAEAGLPGKTFFLLKGLVSGDKKSIIIVAALVFLILAGGGLAYFLLGGPKPQKETVKQVEKAATQPLEKPEKGGAPVLTTDIYVLEPFFLPVNMGPQQAVRFVNLKINFLLSNRVMKKNIEKNIGPIRQKIYSILKRKTVKDYTENKIRLERQLKEKIPRLANNFLASGTGIVEDVFFTQFIIK